MKQRKTGLMYSDAFANYEVCGGYLTLAKENNEWITDDDYYDTPERVIQAYAMLQKSGLLDWLVPVKAQKLAKKDLIDFHSAEYIEKLDYLSKNGGGDVGEMCHIGADGLDVIREAVGGDLGALDAVMQGDVDNAFCLQRPPGAHAERDKGFGFCVVNNFNIMAEYARRKYNLKRIMIIDFDNHYKKGIEDAWYDTDEVLYAEIHQSGAVAENSSADRNATQIGAGNGLGYNVVIPMPSGAGDDAYIKAFEEIIVPVADQYKPELVILVAGFASNIFDPLCRQQLTANGYKKLTEIICGIAERNSGGKLVAVLEGGKGNYMAFCIHKVLEAMSGEVSAVPDLTEGLILRNYVSRDQSDAIENVKKILAPYWKF